MRYNVAKIAALRRIRTAVATPQSASLTAPLTQGSLGAVGIVMPLNSNLVNRVGNKEIRLPYDAAGGYDHSKSVAVTWL